MYRAMYIALGFFGLSIIEFLLVSQMLHEVQYI